MNTYVIFLLTRVYYDFNHPKTDKTPNDDISVEALEKGQYEKELESCAQNVTVEKLHEFECKHDDFTQTMMAWYREWEHGQKESAHNNLFSDDGGMSSIEDHERQHAND